MILYLFIKSIHILSIISWLAGLLYLPRLFVYHSKSEIGSIQSETFKIMERRLLKAIMLPAMISSFITGAFLIYLDLNLIQDLSIQIKLIFVLMLAGVHGKFIKFFKDFNNDIRNLGDITFRIWNEVPTCLMIIIVLLIILRPF